MKEIEYFRDLEIDESSIKVCLSEMGETLWMRCIWLKIETSCLLLCTR